MTNLQRRLAGARAASRVLSVGQVERPPRRALFRRHPWFRRGVIAVTVVAFLFIQQVPARTFLGLDPAGWAVVTQMAALVSQMIAVKRQVENQRDQARAHIYGKIAPIEGKLSIAHNFLSTHLDPVNAPWFDPGGQAAIPEEPFNQPLPDCVPGSPLPSCMPDINDAVLPDNVRNGARSATQTVLAATFGGSVPAHVNQSVDRLFTAVEYYADRSREQRQAREDREAKQRAVTAMSMGILEEWRGCNRSTVADPYSIATVQRPPCFSAGGEGRGDTLSDGEVGTEGMLEGLYEMLDFVENNQEGDASLTQLATIETQVALMRGRLQAANLELDLLEVEENQRVQLASEAAARRADELDAMRLECVQANAGGSVHNYLVYNPEDPAASECVQVDDITAAQIALLNQDISLLDLPF